jgi:hypothetical protein
MTSYLDRTSWQELKASLTAFSAFYPIRKSVVNVSAVNVSAVNVSAVNVSAVPILRLSEIHVLSLAEQAQKNPARTSARGLKVTNGFAITRQRGRYSWSTAQTFTIR